MISGIIRVKVIVISQSERLRLVTLTETSINQDNSIVLMYNVISLYNVNTLSSRQVMRIANIIIGLLP